MAENYNPQVEVLLERLTRRLEATVLPGQMGDAFAIIGMIDQLICERIKERMPCDLEGFSVANRRIQDLGSGGRDDK